jgi:hypothetical protein
MAHAVKWWDSTTFGKPLGINTDNNMQETRYLVRQKEMAETFGVKLLGWLGLPMFIFGYIGGPNEIVTLGAQIVGLVMVIIRCVFLVEKLYHNAWMRREERRRLRDKE